MYVATQFSIFMVNKPGVLAQVLDKFAQARINMRAMTMMDSSEEGIMRVVFARPKKAKEVLSKLNMPYNEAEVLCINLTDSSGALAVVVKKLAKSHMNISYAYYTAGTKGSQTTVVFKVADVKKAMQILLQDHTESSKSQPVARRSWSLRK